MLEYFPPGLTWGWASKKTEDSNEKVVDEDFKGMRHGSISYYEQLQWPPWYQREETQQKGNSPLRCSNNHSLMQFIQIYRFSSPRLVVHNPRTQDYVSERPLCQKALSFTSCVARGKLFKHSKSWFPHK